jgi:hypothetical protein
VHVAENEVILVLVLVSVVDGEGVCESVDDAVCVGDDDGVSDEVDVWENVNVHVGVVLGEHVGVGVNVFDNVFELDGVGLMVSDCVLLSVNV